MLAQAIWRRRRMVAVIALAAGLAGLGVARLLPPKYPAEAVLELHVNRADAIGPGETSAAVMVEAASLVMGEARILRSPVIARRVVERLGLVDNLDFVRPGLVGQVLGRFGAWFGGGTPANEPAARARRVDQAERRLARGLAVETDNRSYLITIRYTASRPELAVSVTNAVAEEYLARRAEANIETAGRTADWLAGQIRETRLQLRRAEQDATAYRSQAGLISVGGQTQGGSAELLQQQQLRELSSQLNVAALARLAGEARLARVRGMVAAGTAAAAPDLLALPPVQQAMQRFEASRRELADLQTRLGPRHPAVQQAKSNLSDAEAISRAELERGLAGLEASQTAATVTEDQLRAQVARLRADVMEDLSESSELRNREATAQVLRDRLVGLIRAHDQTLGIRDLRTVPASLVVPAQPAPAPTGIAPPLVGLLGGLGGLLVGVGLVACLERLDRGVANRADVERVTDLRCLGAVPEMPAEELRPAGPGLPGQTPAHMMFDEALRTVGAGIGLFGAGPGGRIVLVTSAIDGEGRGAVAEGLARVVAQAGHRVLLIQGPPRRLGDPGGTPAATHADHAKGGADVTAIAGPERPEGLGGSLVVLRRDAKPAASFDVFASPRLRQALEQIRDHFDLVLIEGPPLMLVSDGVVLGRLADQVVHVVKWADTRQSTLRAALRRLQENAVRVDGVVLARVDTGRQARLGLADPEAFECERQSYLQGPPRLAAPAVTGPAARTAHGG